MFPHCNKNRTDRLARAPRARLALRNLSRSSRIPSANRSEIGRRIGESRMSEKKGEGSYEGAEQFQKDQHKFAKKGPVESKAREAAEALDGEEAEELERARRATAKGSK
jgi:hypothetical protein